MFSVPNLFTLLRLLLAPAVIWAVLRLLGSRPRAARATAAALVVACGALFLWFSPLLDGRRATPDSYNGYMWLRSWR
jgi:dolichyl-phosphate-mannose--protein O-mannosyl transferase